MVTFGAKRVMAQIDDVSSGGLRLRTPLTAPVGTCLDLHGMGARVQARLVWCDGAQMGLAFVGDPAQGDLRQFIGALMRAPLPGRGARMHGFTELETTRPALPDAPLPRAPQPQAHLQTGSGAARGDRRPDGSDKSCGSD